MVIHNGPVKAGTHEKIISWDMLYDSNSIRYILWDFVYTRWVESHKIFSWPFINACIPGETCVKYKPL